MSRFLLFVLVIALSNFTHLNAQHKFCGSDDVLREAIDLNPNFNLEYKKAIETAIQNAERTNDSIYTVRVVFHILYNPNDIYQNVSDELIQSQLDALNRDFNMQNADTADTRLIFKDLAGNAKIKFVLAKNRPNGNCGNAIIRKSFNAPSNLLPIFSDFLIKEDWTGGSAAWNAAKYLNIWVMDLNKGRAADAGFLGGYAYFPAMQPLQYNGVVMDYRFFGQNNPVIEAEYPNFARFNLGRACVHEVGHWLGLRHIWGDLGTLDPSLGCTADDGIDDTPNAVSAYSAHGNCSDTIVNSCLDEPIDYPDMFENYMDYSSDECQSMFTINQVQLMRYNLAAVRTNSIVEVQPNTIETYELNVVEKNSASICMELGDCFGLANMKANFYDDDSTTVSDLGSAEIKNGFCIDYKANAYNADNSIDSLIVILFDERFREYDTSIIVVKISEQCPKKDTLYFDVLENSVISECLVNDPCLSGDFELSLCNGNQYNSNALSALIETNCLKMESAVYNANNQNDTICLLSDYGNVTDTTYVIVSVSPATSINLDNQKHNGINIYPNPTNGIFTIEQVVVSKEMKLTIYNSIGEQVFTRTIQDFEKQIDVDISNLQKGIYILAFERKDNLIFERLSVQ